MGLKEKFIKTPFYKSPLQAKTSMADSQNHLLSTEERNKVQKASEALLIQRLMSILKSDITYGSHHHNRQSNRQLTTDSIATDTSSQTAPSTLTTGNFSTSLSNASSTPRSPLSKNHSATLMFSSFSAGASVCSSGMISPENWKREKDIGLLPLFGNINPRDLCNWDDNKEAPDINEALKAIREKMAMAKKKKNNVDPITQLNIVKGILQLAAIAASCSGAMVPMPLEPHEDNELKEKQKEAKSDPEEILLHIDLTAPAEVLRHEGMQWLKALASAGGIGGRHPLPEAQYYLAQLLRGQGDERLRININLERAFMLSLQASKHGLPEATYATGASYEYGLGVKKDPVRAVTFYRKAASLGHARAMHRMAQILQNGQLGQAASPKEAFSWLKRAASLGSLPAAIHDLALMYESNNPASAAIPDDAYALELLKKAASMGFATSMVKLGTCYEYGRLECPVDAKQSIEWYRKAAELGDPAAELALSGWYLTGAKDVENGVILPQSDEEAYFWAKRAAERHDPRAEYAMGRYCELGIGLSSPQLQEALNWYGLAARQGHRKAKKRRSELKKTIKFSSSSSSFSSVRFVKSLLMGGRWNT